MVAVGLGQRRRVVRAAQPHDRGVAGGRADGVHVERPAGVGAAAGHRDDAARRAAR